jgi:hypothetical protein
MKTNKPKSVILRRMFSQRRTTAHNPWLVMNLELFNFAGGWNQLVANAQAQQFQR